MLAGGALYILGASLPLAVAIRASLRVHEVFHTFVGLAGPASMSIAVFVV